MKATDLLAIGELNVEDARRIMAPSFTHADDGELYLQYGQSEVLVRDNGRLKTASFDTNRGFGLRVVAGEAVGYAHSGEISKQALKRASDAVSVVSKGYSGVYAQAPHKTNAVLYSDENPLGSPSFSTKIGLLEEIDAYARAKDVRVAQVSVSLAASWETVQIIRIDGEVFHDTRPLVRLNVSIVVESHGRREQGSFGIGGREGFEAFIGEQTWQQATDEALRQALVNLEAIEAPAGEMDVVLGAGWPGILLHEAVGHGLEGDFNRKKTSAFAGLMGERIASPGVTVVDDGTIDKRRGSLSIDDEGTPTERTVLIEDGILKGYMQDRQNARLMNMAPTGNGRRQSYAHIPMPRMTNTIMLSGQHTPEEVIGSVDKGIYAVSFGGGQVDITSGKFVFSCTEAYHLENGKIGAPVKGAMLIGNGPDALTKIALIGNDMAMDPGIGTCGKNGQGVPVGVGQPTLRIDALTIGGTAGG